MRSRPGPPPARHLSARLAGDKGYSHPSAPRLLRRRGIRSDPGGKASWGRNFYNCCWKPAIDNAKKHGLEVRPRIHDLLHTHVSWLIAQGVQTRVASRPRAAAPAGRPGLPGSVHRALEGDCVSAAAGAEYGGTGQELSRTPSVH
ncbi:MAG TPA: hypothetical protein VGS60_03670 [Actinomycetes bacterium]|nr:hypothetical protein [Actinomycetes bacterium]